MEYLEGQSLLTTLRAARGGPAAMSQVGAPSEPVPLDGPPSTMRPGPSSPQGVDSSGARRGPPMPLPFFLRAIADALDGLHYAHELCDHDGSPLHIVHRDVSPGNIFLTYDGTVKLLDFGIAKAADSSLHTRTGMLKGKVAYMAPEQLRQGHALGRRSDLFAVGVMLWEAATGQRLWRGVGDLEILMRLSKGQLPRPSECAAGVNPRLEAVCWKAMAVDPAARHATAAELRDEVEAVLDEVGPVTTRELGAYVSGLFATQRAEARSFVRRKLDELRVAQEADELQALPPRSQPAHSSRDDTHQGALPLTVSRPVRRDSLMPTGRRRARWATLAFAGGLGVSGATLWARNDPAATSRAAPAAVTAAASPLPPAPAPVRLTVAASPADALIFVDGAPVVVNPYSATVAADGRKHEVRAEAAGFVPQAKEVEFLGPVVSVDFTLERRHAPGRRPAAGPGGRGAADAPHRGRGPHAGPGDAAAASGHRGEGVALDRGSPWDDEP